MITLRTHVYGFVFYVVDVSVHVFVCTLYQVENTTLTLFALFHLFYSNDCKTQHVAGYNLWILLEMAA